MSDIAAKVKARFHAVEVPEPAPIKGAVTLKLTKSSDWLGVLKMLKEEMGFEWLDFLTAVDWKGPVDARGYIMDPNPNPFLPEGAVPEITPDPPTPGFPYRESIEMLVALSNWTQKTRVYVRTELPRATPKVASIVSLWNAADWQERETYDLLGVVFEGHPNLKKVLTPDFMQGHPLRKDYVHVKDKYD